MQSKTFRHPGTFYITSDRLCFRSSVLGMEARLSISWSQLEWARLVKSESSMHPVRICLRQPIAIDAVEVDSFDLMIFDVGILAQLHACVSYFNGTGLFDMVPLSKTEPAEPVEYSSSPGIGESLESGPRARMSAMTPEEMIADLEEASLVWSSNAVPPFGIAIGELHSCLMTTKKLSNGWPLRTTTFHIHSFQKTWT